METSGPGPFMRDIFAINSTSYLLLVLDFEFLSDLVLAICTCLEIYLLLLNYWKYIEPVFYIFLLAYEVMVSL